VDTPEAAAAAAAALLGAAAGRVYVEQVIAAKRSFAITMACDLATGTITCACRDGCHAIRLPIDIATGLMPHHARRLAFGLGLEGAGATAAGAFLVALYRAFLAVDALSLIVDPAIMTADGAVLVGETRIDFDSNALFRHPEILELREEDADDIVGRAARQGLCYVRLDGNVGCLSNGAGLAMASMDLVRLHGGRPASFLDISGSATREQMTAALLLMLADAGVEALLLSFFGGLMRCDAIAEGLIAAIRDAGVQVPVVVRLAGTNVDLGRRILNESGLTIVNADSLDTAAAEVVKAVREYA
jgi:succinyl-CoA synthetase beta subunit